MKTYTVTKRFSVDVERTINAESIAEAEEKSKELPLSRFLKPAPGAHIVDWGGLSGTNIAEERE